MDLRFHPDLWSRALSTNEKHDLINAPPTFLHIFQITKSQHFVRAVFHNFMHSMVMIPRPWYKCFFYLLLHAQFLFNSKKLLSRSVLQSDTFRKHAVAATKGYKPSLFALLLHYQPLSIHIILRGGWDLQRSSGEMLGTYWIGPVHHRATHRTIYPALWRLKAI